jgi:hypothetical protein
MEKLKACYFSNNGIRLMAADASHVWSTMLFSQIAIEPLSKRAYVAAGPVVWALRPDRKATEAGTYPRTAFGAFAPIQTLAAGPGCLYWLGWTAYFGLRIARTAG